MKIGVLSTLNSPLLGYTLEAMLKEGLQVSAVLLDSKNLTEKDLQIWNQRTENRMPLISPYQFSGIGIPFYFVDSHNSTATVNIINQLDLDLLVNGGTPRILTSETLDAVKLGVLNIHPGKLPDYRGCTCPEWAIYNDDQVFNTVHFMTDKIDAGDIVAEEACEFPKLSNYVDVRINVYKRGFSLLAPSVKQLSLGGTPQQREGGQQGNYYKPMSDDLLEDVKRKLSSGTYKYQCL